MVTSWLLPPTMTFDHTKAFSDGDLSSNSIIPAKSSPGPCADIF